MPCSTSRLSGGCTPHVAQLLGDRTGEGTFLIPADDRSELVEVDLRNLRNLRNRTHTFRADHRSIPAAKDVAQAAVFPTRKLLITSPSIDHMHEGDLHAQVGVMPMEVA